MSKSNESGASPGGGAPGSGVPAAGGRPVIGFGLVGWGSIAKVHLLGLRSLPVLFPALPFDVGLRTAVTRDPAGKGEEARRAGFEQVTADALAAARAPELDVLDICTPNALHPAVARAGWEAGKFLHIEKPLAESLESARSMWDAWRAAGSGTAGASAMRPDQVAFTLRFLPAVARAADLLARGDLGPILSFRARISHGGYLNPQRPLTWRLDKGMSGGGALADLGIHLIDLVQFLLGDITEVAARTRTFVEQRPVAAGGDEMGPVTVDDWAEVRCTLATGAVGIIEATRAADGLEGTVLEVFGRDGSLSIRTDMADYPQWFDRPSGQMHTRTPALDGPLTRALLQVYPPAKLTLGSFADTHAASLHWFLQRVQAFRGQPALSEPAASLGDAAISARLTPGIPAALRAQAVLETAYSSAASGGKAVAVPTFS
ncbi:MAG: Gfo/Idh/MocA family protein [Symbiobacteriia bacterium]